MKVLIMVMVMMMSGLCRRAKFPPRRAKKYRGAAPAGRAALRQMPLGGRPPPGPLLARRLRTVLRVARAPAQPAPPRQAAVPWCSKDEQKDDNT